MSVLSARQVLHFESTPEDVIADAQVAVVTADSWHIYGPRNAHGVISFAPVPVVHCPIVDVSMLPAAMDEAVKKLMVEHQGRYGYKDIPTLLAEFRKLGAVVSEPM